MRRLVPPLLALLANTTSLAQPAVPVPSDEDIPKPLPIESSLAGAARPDISRFLNIRKAIDPALSPDGTRLAFRSAITGTQQVWTVASSGGWPRQLTFVEGVTFHAWSPRGDWIVYGADVGGNEREGYYLVSPDGMRERELLAPSDAFRRFGGFTRDGSQIAYATTGRTENDFDIHLIDVASGADREVFSGRLGLFAVAWRPDARAVVLSETRGEDANDLFLLDLATGETQTLFKPAVASRYDSVSWEPDGGGFYLVTNQDREYQALARYDIATRALSVLEAPEHDVEAVALSRDGKLLAWIGNAGGYSRLHLRDVRAGKDLPVPPLPRGVYKVRWAESGSVAAIHITGPQTPGDVWILDAASGRATRATESSTAGLDMTAMVVPEHHDFRAADGTPIHGLLYRPTNVAAGTRLPVVLAVHGGPTAQARPEFSEPDQYLLTRGIAILDLNYRGSTGYGKTFARLNDGRLRENELEDLEGAVRWIGTQPGLDARRVAIMGGSYGGYLTMAGVARLPALFKSGVAFVGVSNWLTALDGASPELKASDRIEYGDVDDESDRVFFRQISPLTYADRVRSPMLVVHGANDPRDPVAESDQFVSALRERDVEVQYLRFPDEGHGVRKLPNRVITYRRIADFLERTLAE
jgi:dipeptidyl aminopeptidase/acylaminoacyl peptidase